MPILDQPGKFSVTPLWRRSLGLGWSRLLRLRFGSLAPQISPYGKAPPQPVQRLVQGIEDVALADAFVIDLHHAAQAENVRLGRNEGTATVGRDDGATRRVLAWSTKD